VQQRQKGRRKTAIPLPGGPYFQIHVLNETDKNRIIEQLTDHLLLLVTQGA